MDINIRRITESDYQNWLALWNAYLDFAGATLEEGITEYTWQRMLSPNAPLLCWVADVDGTLAGFAVAVLHEGAWVKQPVCYLEDLFVAEHARGAGVGRVLLENLRTEAKSAGWSRIYWLTRENSSARHLYDKVAAVGDFVRYTMKI